MGPWHSADYDVFCEICNARWGEQDRENVTFHYDPARWECADEAACLERAAAQERTV